MTDEVDTIEAKGRLADVLVMRAVKRAPPVGSKVELPVDRILLDGPTAYQMLTDLREEQRGADKARLGFHKAQRFVIVAGAAQPRDDQRRVVDFARKHSLAVQLEAQVAGDPSVVAVDLGLVHSDDVVMGSWREVGSLGGLGCLVLPATRHELTNIAGAKRTTYPVPHTCTVSIEGRIPRWLGPFDVALATFEECGGLAALAGKVVEFCGDTVDAMSVPERMMLCGTLAQLGVTGMVAPDESTNVWLRARSPRVDGDEVRGTDSGRRRLERRVAARERDGKDALGEIDVTINARRLVPRMVSPVKSARVIPIDVRKPVTVSHVVLTGRVDSLRIYSEVARERRVKRGVHVAWIPASQRTLLHAIEEGLVTDLLRSGGTLLPPGSRPEDLGQGDRRATTHAFDGEDVLVSPAMAASSALAGHVVDPETMRRQQPRSTRPV